MANVIHNDECFKNVSTKFKNKRWIFTNCISVQHFILEDLTILIKNIKKEIEVVRIGKEKKQTVPI